VPTTSDSATQPSAKKPGGLAHLLLHLHPKMVPEETLPLDRTFGLGGAALVLLLVLIASGALLLFAYEPSTERAWGAVRALEDDVPFGSFVRAIHHWAGNLFLVVAALHLLRVFFTGAFLPPRRFNWLLGIGLLALAAVGNFTGYLLPWDQLAYWAVTIGTGMLKYVPLAGEGLVRMARGGPDVSPKTLSLFFVFHIAIIPILLFGLLSFHFWLVRKAGGVMRKGPEGGATTRPRLVPVSPDLTVREGAAALVTLAAVFLLAAVFRAPLEAAANPGLSPNPAKAPWYFMGVQELLVQIHPTFAVLVVPLLGAAFLAGLPFLRYPEPPNGNWFQSARGRKSAAFAAFAALVLAPAAILLAEHGLRADRFFPGLPPAVSSGVIPLAIWALLAGALLYLLVRALSLSRLETVQALFTFLLVAFLVLTIVGVVFRGPSMRLVFPGGTA
jgi:quinol-cytochrome oxidoreductase complex cytochrome b subunit